MSIDEKWLTREKWTLVEAALICAGIEPYAGGEGTDSPHEVLQRIPDPIRRELFSELYARSKDALDDDTLIPAEASGNVGNTRVQPSLYVIWAIDSRLPKRLRSTFDTAKAMLGPVLGPSIPRCPDDSLIANRFGYTVDGAARALHERYGADEDKWRERIFAATKSNALRVRDPEDGAYYKPETPRRFWERISVADLSDWLEQSGTGYELHDSPTPDPRPGSSKSVSRQRVIDGFPVRREKSANRKFWDDKLSRPPNWLIGARISVGKRGISSMWNPALVAHCL